MRTRIGVLMAFTTFAALGTAFAQESAEEAYKRAGDYFAAEKYDPLSNTLREAKKGGIELNCSEYSGEEIPTDHRREMAKIIAEHST